MILSSRTKEAIKTGLAVAIALAIALAMDWKKPYWGPFAAFIISLDTTGQSLNKAALRMLGTLVAGATVFIFLAFFAQQRWAMALCLSIYYGFCTYMMTGSKRPYFWAVSAWVCMVIMVNAGPANALHAFQTVLARVEENATGILVYSLITLFLWPRSSRSDLEAASRKLSATQRQLYQSCRGLMMGRGEAKQFQTLRMQEVHLLTVLGQALDAAQLDTYEVWEVRRQWRAYQQLSKNLAETLGGWRESFAEIQQLDLSKVFPNLETFIAELDHRFAQIERMLNGEAPTSIPKPISLTIDGVELSGYAHFQRAALAVTKTQIDRIETLSRKLFDCVQHFKGYATGTVKSPVKENVPRGFAFDLDRFKAAMTLMAALWIPFLIWIFIDPPGHALFVFLTSLFVLLSVMLRVHAMVFAPGLALGIVVAGIVYVFVMPNLSGYGELGLMLFGVTFGIFYLFSEPRHRMTRTASMAVFLILISVENQQSYNFAHYANTAVAIPLAFAVAFALTSVTTSPRPEKAFLGLLRRFFRHAEFLMSRLALDRDEQNGLATRWQMALYRNELLGMPGKLAALGQQIDYRVLPGTTAEQVQALARSLQALAYRVTELVDAREASQADLLVEAVIDDVRSWRMLGQKQFRLWADDPVLAVEEGVDMRDRLRARIAKLEGRISETLRAAGEGKFSEREFENFYRYLGAFRGLSESGIEYARLAEKLNWAQWEEERF